MDEVSALVQAFDHGGNRLRGGIHVRTEHGKGDLLVILLQAVDFGGISPHGGTDGHGTPENMRSASGELFSLSLSTGERSPESIENINQVENRLQSDIK
jgi:hypothetical protein